MMDVRKMASMGQKAMRENQSKAEKIFWPLKAGRPGNSKPGVVEALHLGRSAANRLMDAMKAAELAPRDARCALACATSNDKVRVFPFEQQNQDSSDLEILRDIVNSKPRLEPIGISFVVFDRERGNLLLHVRPFERSDRSERLMEAVILEMERSVENLNKKGLGAVKGN